MKLGAAGASHTEAASRRLRAQGLPRGGQDTSAASRRLRDAALGRRRAQALFAARRSAFLAVTKLSRRPISRFRRWTALA